MRRRNARGQAEMMGLAVIMILLALGFLFYVKFFLKVPGNNIRASYEQTQLGQTFLNSLAKTELECGISTYTVQRLVKSIASGQPTCDAELTLELFLEGVSAPSPMPLLH